MEVLNAEDRELLKLIFKNPLGRGSLENGQLGGFCKRSNEFSYSLKCGEFF
jgi:hypothetical protein